MMVEAQADHSGKIIFLHGASSSGKSTIARALQAKIELPFWHISIDHLRDAGVLPSTRIDSGEFRWSDMRAQFFDGFHRSLAAYAGAGNNLIVEHILDTKGWLEDLQVLLKPYDVFFVGIHCSLDTLVQREEARGDRPIGSATQDFHNIHQGMRYDFELDSEDGLEGNLDRLLSAWRDRSPLSVFAKAEPRS